jgi:hypothetical protein
MSNTPLDAIIAKVREYNLWRRGSDQLAQPDPTEIGLYLDAVCDIAESLERERDEARKSEMAAQKECLEQARLIGMSADREADLRTKIDYLGKKLEESRKQLVRVHSLKMIDECSSCHVPYRDHLGLQNICQKLQDVLREQNNLQDQRNFAMGEIERLRKERDEARKELQRIIDHYSQMQRTIEKINEIFGE